MSINTFFIAFILFFNVIFSAFALPMNKNAEISEDVVRVYNWSDYIPKTVLDDFTKETGINVEYSTYDNNEIMYTKLRVLKGRGYDVLVPSTDLVSKMIKEGLIQSIDHEKLAGYSHLDPYLLNKPYDMGNKYSIPYLWGTTGIGINTANIKQEKIVSWGDLWHKQWRGKLLLVDDMREVFHMALKLNGHSINTTDATQINLAYQKLWRLMPNVKLFSADAPQKLFVSGDIDIGVVWNGEVVTAHKKKSTIAYIYPKEGASFWIDSFVIPSRALNVDNAHKFIDYMLRPDIAARCVKALGYATANLEARALLDKSIMSNTTIFPPTEVLKRAEFKQDVGKAREIYQLYWKKLKAGRL
jgi:spermidine/putrescine transport system substrate-binding protein